MKRDLSWLGSLSLSTGKKPNLTAMKFLTEKLGHPERKMKFVHVAGTNGKGSVTEMMAKILECAGLRTGKFMSPHLVKFNERIQVDGREISDGEIEEILDFLQPAIDEYEEKFGTGITLFEIETIMALVYYARKGCEVVALEVGLGGEFDCTNIVEAEVSVIVSIGMDHMNILGNSLAEIATQKAGIIKHKGKVVTGKLPKEAREVVARRCAEMGATWRETGAVRTEATEDGVRIFDEEFGEILVGLRGECQGGNAAICLECVRILREAGVKVSDGAVREGLRKVVHRGRFETVMETGAGFDDFDGFGKKVVVFDGAAAAGKKVVVFDGAHNLPAVENFWKNVETYYADVKHKRMVVSLLKRKDARGILPKLLRKGVEYVFTTGNDAEIYTPAEELLEIAREISPEVEGRTGDLVEVLKKARDEEFCGVTFVVGSFYVYKEVAEVFGEE